MDKINGGRAAGKNPSPERNDKSVKVKYISSPVMVEAKNPSQFKEIVQHFTGQTPNGTTYSRFSNPTNTTTTMAGAAPANTTTSETACQFFAYGATNKNIQVQHGGIDGYSWEEIAEWNRYQ